MALPSNDSDFISQLSTLLNTDRDAIVDRVEKLDVNTLMDMLDALKTGKTERVAELMQTAEGSDENVDVDVENIDGDEDEIETENNEPEDDEVNLNPLFQKANVEPGDDEKDIDADVEDDESVDEEFKADPHYRPNIGDEVRVQMVKDHKRIIKTGIVKVAQAPRDTIRVMLDGEMTMVKRTAVGPMKEHVMGMTPMIDIRRMQELAGVPSSPLAPGAVDVQLEAPPVPLTPLAPPATEVISVPDVAPVPALDPDTARIDAAFAQIEASLPEIKFADVKGVRERLNRLMMKLNEAA